MNVKAQGLLNGAKWLEEQYGRDGLRDVIRACSESVRERYTSAIAIEWHPVVEFVEFVSVADRLLGRGDGRLAEEMGAAAARANTKGFLLRIVFYIARPDLFLIRIAGLWRQFNDEGAMEAPVIDERHIHLRVHGMNLLPRMFCNVLTGWIREMARISGGVDPVVRVIEHVDRGPDAHCVWELRWSRLDEGSGSIPPGSMSSSGFKAAK